MKRLICFDNTSPIIDGLIMITYVMSLIYQQLINELIYQQLINDLRILIAKN